MSFNCAAIDAACFCKAATAGDTGGGATGTGGRDNAARVIGLLAAIERFATCTTVFGATAVFPCIVTGFTTGRTGGRIGATEKRARGTAIAGDAISGAYQTVISGTALRQRQPPV
jgi:hypothetical protein